MTASQQIWQKAYQCLPLGYVLRESYPSRWLRIHSLPDSKRYPENNAELKVLFQRHRKVAHEILGTESTFIIYCPSYNSDGRFDPLPNSKYTWIKSFTSLSSDQNTKIDFYCSDVELKNGSFELLIEKVAMDKLEAVFLNPISFEIYAPYDGGADIIVANSERRDSLKQKFENWLSKRADGL